MATGLILEGGGMRGIYTAGVLDFFLEKNIMFQSIYAVSAGSCHACSYLSRQKGRAKVEKNRERLQALYEQGYADAAANYQALLQFLQ